MTDNQVDRSGQPGGLDRIPDAREEAGFLPKDKLDALDPDVRARVVALARENSGLREQNGKLFERLTVTPQVAPAQPATKSEDEEIRDEGKFPTDRLLEYTDSAVQVKASLAAMDPEDPRFAALKAEAGKIDDRVLKLARRELIRREATAAVMPELHKDRENKEIQPKQEIRVRLSPF